MITIKLDSRSALELEFRTKIETNLTLHQALDLALDLGPEREPDPRPKPSAEPKRDHEFNSNLEPAPACEFEPEFKHNRTLTLNSTHPKL